MCGINGIIDFNQKISCEEKKKLIELMNSTIVYRGPDEEGIYSSDYLCMGMRRLSIIDLSLGHQPIYNEDRTIMIVFNGEIYNYQTLKLDLEGLGHIFATNSDTEVIIHAYEEYGNSMFNMLDGMFALSIYDSTKRELIIARDRMGEKPLYYYKDLDYFIYSSELKGLLATELIKKEINNTALCQYLQLTYIPAPYSIFKGIYKVMPGHYLKISDNGTIIDSEYWSFSYECDKINDYKKAKELLLKEVKESVKQRMISDVPIGAFLSGGIDSGSIVALMASLSDRPIETFTIGFKERAYDEKDRARKVAKMYGTNHHEYILDYEESLEIINEILKKMDEPFADSSALPTYFVSHFASQYVKVVLTGDAGDELFSGYNKYLIGYYSNLYKHIPKWFRNNIIEPLIYLLKDSSNLTRKVRKVIENVDKDLYQQRKEMMCLAFKEYEIDKLLKSEYVDVKCLDFIKSIYDMNKDVTEMEKAQYVDLKIVLEGDMLTKVDRMSMLNSLETRVPLLSKEILKLSTRLPVTFKIRRNKLKRIWKDTMKKQLPKGFIKKPKSGFSVPVDYWFRNQLKEELLTMLSKSIIEEQGIFNFNYIEQILQEHFSEKRNRKSEIWSLYVFQKWYIEWMK